jgi:hypothetical protein
MATDRYKPKIFISYAHLDEPERPVEGEIKWLSFVVRFLRVSERQDEFEVFTDQLIPGGVDWDPEIEEKLRACDIFILLVSPHSMASDYIVKNEIKIIRERQNSTENVYFYPLLLTPTPKAGLDLVRDKNLRPRGMNPLSSYSSYEREKHMVDAADEIDQIAKEIAARTNLIPLLRKSSSSQPTKPPLVSSPLPSLELFSPRLDAIFEYLRSYRKILSAAVLILSFSIILGKWIYEKMNSPSASNDAPPLGSSVWGVSGTQVAAQVDGSTVYLVGEGLKRTFKFLKPSPKMSSLGALPNDLLFDGEADAIPPKHYTGNAQAFKRCGNSESYHVEGPVRDGPVVELSGTMPVFDEGEKCQRKQDGNVTLTFSFQSKRN